MGNQHYMKFSHAVGYHGLATLRNTLLLCTGGNISLTQEPIMGSGVWGAGYANIAPIAYAWNYLQLEGSMNIELTTGKCWESIRDACIEDRVMASIITLKPDGKNGFNGFGWCSSLSVEASEGSALTSSINFKGDPAPVDDNPENYNVDNLDKTDDNNNYASVLEHTYGIFAGEDGDSSKYGRGYNSDPEKSEFAGATLVPYWRTTVRYNCDNPGNNGIVPYTSGESLNDIISWNASYNSDLQLLKCCNMNTAAPESPLHADYIVCGEASCDGSFTVFKIADMFAPGAYHRIRKNLSFFINMSDQKTEGEGNTGATYELDKIQNITIPSVIMSSGSTSMTTGANYITSEFNFTGIGDSVNPIFCMSLKK